MPSPNERKPAAFVARAGSEMSISFAAIDKLDFSDSILDRQAARVLGRFRVSWPVARIIAELAFGIGGAT